MATVQGLDISACQGSNVDFAKIKAAGYKFVILRVNEWSKVMKANVKDSCFESFYKKAKAAGLDVGAYFFTYANTVDYVAKEAALCIEWIKGKQFEYPIYFDLEREQQFNQGRYFCDNAVKTFCNALEKAGYFAGVYCSTFWYTKCVSASVRERYACWIADWNSQCTYKGTFGMWQNGTANVSGIVGGVDHDYCYIDYPSIIKSKGLNGFKKATTAPTVKVLDSGSCYNKGETTVGALAVKEMLRLAYNKKLHSVNVTESKVYDDSAINAVKALQKAWGYKETGGAGENFVKMLYSKIK